MFNTILPKIHKEGYKFLAISILATFIILIFSKFLGSIFILISVWVYYFFRDPDRISINDDNYLVTSERAFCQASQQSNIYTSPLG